MSIENIDLLIKNLQHIRKQLIEQSSIHPIDKDLLKKQILNFYQNEFYPDNSTASINENHHEPLVSINQIPSTLVEKEISNSNNPVEPIISSSNLINQVDIPVVEKTISNIVTEAETVISTPPITNNPIIEKTIETSINNEVLSIKNEIITTPENINVIHETTTNDLNKEIKSFDLNSNIVERANENMKTGLNEMMSNSNTSLNDRFQSSTSLADKLNTKNKSMNELIDLNKKLLFVDVLFNGNNQLFTQVIQHIDEYKTATEAIQFIEFNKNKLQITEKKESVYQTFLDLINKKFN